MYQTNPKIVSSNTSEVSGSTSITNMIKVTQVQYDWITPDANTLYIIIA